MARAFAAALLVLTLAAASARAADPMLVARVETYLREDEKALLAALLADPDASSAFDVEAPLALKDPKTLKFFLDAWRGRMVAFAERDVRRPTPDLHGQYRRHQDLMTPETRAYLDRRMISMTPGDRDKLLGYLGSVDSTLAKNGQLSWYTRKVVDGIYDAYRKDLREYVETPLAQTAKRDAPAAAQALAQIVSQQKDQRIAPSKTPGASPPPGDKPSSPESSLPPGPANVASALRQAEGALLAAWTFDGGGDRGRLAEDAFAVAVPASSGLKPVVALTRAVARARPARREPPSPRLFP